MDILKSKILWPSLALGFFVLLYTAYWFHMAGRIAEEIEGWVAEQAKDHTTVTYTSLNVTGYPFRLVATIKDPDIFVQGGNRRPHWRGQKLKAIAQAYSLNHVILDFIGPQSIEVEEDIGAMARPPSKQRYELEGTSIMMSLQLRRGRVLQADVHFEDLMVRVDEIGNYRPVRLTDLPRSFHVKEAQIHSRVRPSDDPEAPEELKVAHDFTVEVLGLTPDGSPPNGFENTIERAALNITRLTGEEVGFHNGSLRLSHEPIESNEQVLTVHEASIDWQPVEVGLSGKLHRPNAKKASGKIDLQIKGHRDLVRVLASEGEIGAPAALLSGALLGVIELVSQTSDDGTLNIPLKIKKGDVSFGFIPLTSIEEIEAAAGL
jgi:hypothetical protein